MPVLLTRLEEHAVAWPYDLDRTSSALRMTDALGDEDGLAVSGACAMQCARRA